MFQSSGASSQLEEENSYLNDMDDSELLLAMETGVAV